MCTIPCNLCAGKDVVILADKDRKGKPLQTVICKDCGMVWTDPRPDAKATKKFYAEDYRKQYKSIAKPKLKHVYRDMHRAIERYRRIKPLLLPGMKLLDVGAGAGFFPYVARSNGFDISGIEPNEGYAEYAGEEFQLQTKTGFVQDFDFNAGSFDIITINHVLEHLEDPYQTLLRLFSWNKAGGYLNVEVPNIEATYHAPAHKFHIAHLYTFNPENLKLLGEKAGYSVYDTQLIPGTQHINILFQKPEDVKAVSAQQDSYTIPGNYDAIMSVYSKHTTLSHYLSGVPYKRFFKKNLGYLKELTAVRRFKSGKEIADYLLAQQQYK